MVGGPARVLWRYSLQSLKISGTIMISGEDALELASKWQVAIAAIFGFTGVCITLWQNARSARRQSIWLREQTRKSVVNAYLAEFEMIVDSTEKICRQVELILRKPDGVVDMHTTGTRSGRCFDKIAFADTMLLGRDALSAVIQAYIAIEEHRNLLIAYQMNVIEGTNIFYLKVDQAQDFLNFEKRLNDFARTAVLALQKEM